MRGRAYQSMIAPGELRIAISEKVQMHSLNWKHWACLSKKQGKKIRRKFDVSNVNTLKGYNELANEDKARVDALLEIDRSKEDVKEESKMPKTPKNPNVDNTTPPKSWKNSDDEDARPEPTIPTVERQGPWSKSRTAPAAGMSPEELKELGNLNYRTRAYETAISYYTQAIDLNPDPIFFSNRAAALMTLKRFNPALDDCRMAALLTRHVPYYKTLARLAKCHLALGDPVAALEAAQASIDCDHTASVDNPSLVTKASAELMKQHLDQSQDAWKRKSWAEARRSLSDGVALCEGGSPEKWCVWEIEMAMAGCDWPEATAAAKKARGLHPNSANVQTTAAQVDLLTNHTCTSLLLVWAALRIEPGHERAGKLLPRVEGIIEAQKAGDRLYGAGQAIEASDEYTKALDLLGSEDEEGRGGHLRVILLGNRAAAYTNMVRFDLARDDGEAALSIPNHPWRLEVLDKLARCCIALGDIDAALRHVEAALDIDPLDKDILAIESSAKKMQANVRQSRESWANKEWLSAKQALARATAECTGERPIQWWIWKVEIEIAGKQWDNAISTAEAIIELHSTSAHAFALLGLAMMLSNRLASCFEPLQSALRLDACHPLAVTTLGRAETIEACKEEGNRAFRSEQYPEAVQKYSDTLEMQVFALAYCDRRYILTVHLQIVASVLKTKKVAEDTFERYYSQIVQLHFSRASQMERHARALIDIVASLELQPKSLKALRTHGRVRMAQGYFEEAIGIYTQARQTWLAGDKDLADGQAIAQELETAEAALETSQSKDYYEILK
ncbi:hypothetical protein FRB97_005624 [Tulasnella sp. 331]|nr:hypothetical protein FRB97_005624 [Tulasnella sp. 331]